MIQSVVTNLPKYAKIKESVPKDKKSKNWEGSTINRILCMYENNILSAAIEATQKRDIEICTLMFDGFMIYGKEYTDEYLEYLSTEVEAKFPGVGMKWAFKPHSTTIQIPDDFDPVIVLGDDECVHSDLDAA